MSTWRCSPTGRRRPRRRGDLRRGAHQALGPRFCLPLAAPACEQAAVAPVPLVVVGTQHGPRPVWARSPSGNRGSAWKWRSTAAESTKPGARSSGPPSARAASSRRRVSARAAHHGRSHRRAARAAPSPAGTKEPASRSAPACPRAPARDWPGATSIPHAVRRGAPARRGAGGRCVLRRSCSARARGPGPTSRSTVWSGRPGSPLAPLALEEVPGKPVTPGAVGHRLPGSRHAGKGDAHRVLGDAEEPCRVHQLGDRELGGSMPSSVLASTERAVRGALRSCGALRCCIR